jgi:hypothetical protein
MRDSKTVLPARENGLRDLDSDDLVQIIDSIEPYLGNPDKVEGLVLEFGNLVIGLEFFLEDSKRDGFGLSVLAKDRKNLKRIDEFFGMVVQNKALMGSISHRFLGLVIRMMALRFRMGILDMIEDVKAN